MNNCNVSNSNINTIIYNNLLLTNSEKNSIHF